MATFNSNLDRWRYYLKDAPSPDRWIDYGWLFAVSAALQRRVWYYRLTERPLFCNLYSFFIGPPACGKNLVITPVKKLLDHWKLNPNEQNIDDGPGREIRRRISTGPDAVTYEKLCEKLAEGTRRFTYKTADGKEAAYSHASMAFVLEEANSLFTRHQDKIPKMLLKTYDCDDYKYETKHEGQSIIRKTCMAFLGGGTPELLRDAAKFSIFDDGFTSRVIFDFELEPRHFRFHIGDFSDEQVSVFADLLNWIKNVTEVFGQLTYSREVYDFLEHWTASEIEPAWRGSSSKMQQYYGRMRQHVLKLAAAFHFSESLSLEITIENVKSAISFLRSLEENMRLGFSAVGRNVLHPISRELLKFIGSRNGSSEAELMQRFATDLTFEELLVVLRTMEMATEIHKINGKYHRRA